MHNYSISTQATHRLTVLLSATIVLIAIGTQQAQAVPTSVTIFGSLQTEVGCASDFAADCANTHLVYDAGDDVWQRAFDLPAGSHVYLAALNDSVAEVYGAGATLGGPNINLSLGANTSVKFYYDDKSHWVTDNQNSRIVVAPGDFQSELGCAGDFDPGCLRAWLQDADGDGIYQFVTSVLPAGNYSTKAAINESFDENYGLGGVRDGANIPFTVPFTNASMLFSFSTTTNVLTVTGPTQPVPEPNILALLALGIGGVVFFTRRTSRSRQAIN